MPNKFAELALTVLIPTLVAIEQEVVVGLLETMYSHDPADHKATCQSLYPGLTRFKVFAEKTKTNFDNVAVDGLLNAIEQSAKEHDVELAS